MDRLIVRNCRIFDGYRLVDDGARLDIAIDRGIIVDIGHIDGMDSALCIDADGRTAVPGLIDAHFHACSPTLSLSTADAMPDSLMAQYARHILEAALQRGFTSVRDMGGADRGLHLAIEQGLIDGPRLFFCGKALSQTGGHGDLRQLGRSPVHAAGCACAYHGSLTRVVDGADRIRTEIRETLRQGAHHIKLMMSGGVLSPTDPLWMPQYSDAEIAAAVEEAGTRRAYVAAHAHSADAAMRCARLGVKSVEHGTLIDAAAARHLADAGCFVVPTLSVMDALLDDAGGSILSDEARDQLAMLFGKAIEAIGHCVDAGVPIGFGTDLLGDLHSRQNREFSLRRMAQSPLDILRSATSVNARLIGCEGKLGTIAKGALADLVLLEGDPLGQDNVLSDPGGISLIVSRGRIARDAAGLISAKPNQ